MSGSPHSPRRQRKALYTADTFERRIRMTVPLSRELRARFHRRSVPVHKGDTVRVLSGSFEGREERVARVDRRSYTVTLDNVTLKTADEKMKPLSLGVAHLVITRLNLSDPWRRRSIRVREEDVTAEERGEAPSEEEEAVPEAATPTPEAPAASSPEPEASPGADEAAAADEAEDEERPTPPSRPTKAKSAEEDDEDA
ncbi:MAG TPA: 50S ribosomal protein L24 [Thermoplasmata archaeon]|nr:50S ribosomal protein L24 [Thermoplasmata archaeon]